MKSLRLYGLADLRLSDDPEPTPGPGEVILRSRSVGICASDLHWFCEGGIGDAQLKRPLVLGHEFSATVEYDPSGQLTLGTRVAVDPAIACGACEYCQKGHPNLCDNLHFAGHGEDDGALRELLPWPKKCCFEIPDSFSFDDGAMLEPLGVAIHSVDLGHLQPGMRVAVLGCGPIGLLAIQVARLAGAAHVIATDRLDHRLEAAVRLGADQVFLAHGGQEKDPILAATRQRGVDVAFEMAGENEAVETAVEIARPGGRVVLTGIPSDDRTAFKASTARRKGLTIACVRRMKHTYPRAIELVEKRLVDVRSIVTHRFRLENSQDAFNLAAQRDGIKVIIEP